MRITLGELRRIISTALLEAPAFPGQPIRNALAPDINTREQVGALSAKAMDTVEDPDGLPDHLLDPQVTPEECFGPVPPDAEDPGVHADPFVKDAAPQPFSGGGSIKRG